MRPALLTFFIAAVFAVGAPAASAATVSATINQNVDPGMPAKGVPPGISYSSNLRVNAPNGETNTISVRTAGQGAVEVEDTTQTPAAGAGCTQQGANVVRCPIAGPLTVNANLGDGDDGWDSGALGATVNGGSGNDTLHAPGRLVGGDGDDTLTGVGTSPGMPSTTVLDGGSGHDRMSDGIVSYAGRREPITVDLARTDGQGAAGENDVITRATGVVGGGGDDVLLGTDGPDRLYGADGVDRIDARGGDDIASGGRPGGNLPLGGVAAGVSPTADHPESVEGGPGNDDVSGGGIVDGSDGDDTVDGDGTLTGGEGNDTIRAESPGTSADGGLGNDSVAESASTSSATPAFGAGPITLLGGPGDDAVGPGGSGDVPANVDGGEGDDTVWAGNIADRGTAGPGNDLVRLIEGDTRGHISCGDGADVLEPSGVANPARRDCERVRPFFGDEGNKILFSRAPAVRGHRATFRFPRTCRDLASLSIVNKCLVRVELRTPSGRLIGLHSVRLHHGGKATVRVPLKRGVKRKDMAIRLHILGSDRSGDQEALNGGWSVP